MLLNKRGFISGNFSFLANLLNIVGVGLALFISYFLIYFDRMTTHRLELVFHASIVMGLAAVISHLSEKNRTLPKKYHLVGNRLYFYAIALALVGYMVGALIGLERNVQLMVVNAVILWASLSIISRYLKQIKFWAGPRERIVLWDNFGQISHLVRHLQLIDGYELVGVFDHHGVHDGSEVIGLSRGQVIDLITNDQIDLILTSDLRDESLEVFRTELKVSGVKKKVQYEVMQPFVPGLRVLADEIDFERLLDREPVQPDEGLMFQSVQDRKILVSGGGGSIGAEIARQIAVYKPSLIVLLDQSEFGLYNIEIQLNQLLHSRGLNTQVVPLLGSVTDRNRLNAIFQAYQIDTVYHAAAYKHVPMVEHNILEGVRNNVLGTRIIAEAAAQHAVNSFILVSTDKAVRPTSIMGATKRFSELVVQGLVSEYPETCFAVVRFGNVLGSSGSVIPRFIDQIKQGGPVTVTHKDVTRYFMSIPEAAQLVIQAGAMATGGEVYLLEMGQPIKIADLAKRLTQETGFKVGKGEKGESDGIELHYTGLRPGEKLYEELLVDGNARKTMHPRIMVAQDFSLEWSEVKLLLAELTEGLNDNDCVSVRDVLLHAGTDYVPQHGLNDLLWLTLEPEPKLTAENVVPIFEESIQKKVV